MELTPDSEKENEYLRDSAMGQLVDFMSQFRHCCEAFRAADTPMDEATRAAYKEALIRPKYRDEYLSILKAHREAAGRNPAPPTAERIRGVWEEQLRGWDKREMLQNAMLQNPEETRKLMQGYQDLLSQLHPNYANMVNYILAQTPEEIRKEMKEEKRREVIDKIRSSVRALVKGCIGILTKERGGDSTGAGGYSSTRRDTRWLAEFALLPSVRLIKDIRDRDGDK